MTWRLIYDPAAEKELSKLDRAVQRTAKKFLAEVCELADPASRGHPLTGRWTGYHRYRVGQLRMIVEIDRNVITVTLVTIGRRDSVY